MVETYEEAIAYLERLVARPVERHAGAEIERVKLLLASLQNPHSHFHTLHVTGSSGKGSTATMAASILQAAGYSVGLFTSPHLHSYTERIVIDGQAIPEHDWARLLSTMMPLIDQMCDGSLQGYTLGRPALFDVLWPLAALYFTEQGVDFAVVEAGIGGRYDPTNINNARVGVITNVSLEHTERLGSTIAEIASHKAGIAKRGGIMVTASDHPDALDVISGECRHTGSSLWRVTGHDGDGAVRFWPESQGLSIQTPQRRMSEIQPRLRGPHQYANAASAVAAVDAFQSLGLALVDDQAIHRGLETASIPGRLEQVARDPVIFLDGAHNADAARVLSLALRDLFPGQRSVFVLGILSDKDYASMVDALAPLAEMIIVTEPPWQARAGVGPRVSAHAEETVSEVQYIPSVEQAFERGEQEARERKVPLIVTGSLILIGAVRSLVRAPV